MHADRLDEFVEDHVGREFLLGHEVAFPGESEWKLLQGAGRADVFQAARIGGEALDIVTDIRRADEAMRSEMINRKDGGGCGADFRSECLTCLRPEFRNDRRFIEEIGNWHVIAGNPHGPS